MSALVRGVAGSARAVHDVRAAREHGIIDALAAVGTTCWAYIRPRPRGTWVVSATAHASCYAVAAVRAAVAALVACSFASATREATRERMLARSASPPPARHQRLR